ncbi:MAG: glutaredoxin family protein [bacterium]|nr:glutaredoxin family protein [bacterium]
MSGRDAELLLYHRYGCHLCEEMLERLRELEAAWGFRVRVTDVDADPELLRRYNETVPVLEGAGAEICRYVLDEEALQQYLSRAARHNPTAS